MLPNDAQIRSYFSFRGREIVAVEVAQYYASDERFVEVLCTFRGEPELWRSDPSHDEKWRKVD